VPEQPAVPTTQYDPVDMTKILISWVEPYDNSDPIQEYNIVFRRSDGIYESMAECVSAVPTLVTSCSVSASSLLLADFNLEYGDLVKVRVQARNTNDWGDLSEANTSGATI
jgi:hypothetical protein